MGEKLQQLGFPLPEVTARYGLATPNRSEDPQPNIANSTAAPCTSTCTQTLDDDDDEGCFGYEGFVSSGMSGRCETCGSRLGLDVDATVLPWSALHAKGVKPESGFEETAQQRAIELLRKKCNQGLYERHCPSCAEAHGHKRKCRRLTPEEIGEGTLSMDLSSSSSCIFRTSLLHGCTLEQKGRC